MKVDVSKDDIRKSIVDLPMDKNYKISCQVWVAFNLKWINKFILFTPGLLPHTHPLRRGFQAHGQKQWWTDIQSNLESDH